MTKVQTGFYQRWRSNEIKATYSSDQTIDNVIEYVEVDTSLNSVQITLPDTTAPEIVNGKEIWIYDSGNAATNNITILPNALDGSSIEGLSSLVVRQNNVVVILELVESTWVVKGNTAQAVLNFGGYSFTGNAAITLTLRS